MLLSEYIANLQQFMVDNGDMPCYYARDAEGNGYEEVSYAGTLFYITKLEHRTDDVYQDLEEFEDDWEDTEQPIAICVVN